MVVPLRKNVLAIVLAGGEGKRLMPLTADRAKPAVPFAGIYRLIDFALSNVVNSGILQVVVLTQYKSHSLDRHITQTWRMSTMLGNYVTPVPAQQRLGKRWYLGSADAIFQSLNAISDERPDIVVVVGADHVYRMDFAQMIEQHVESGAPCTVAAIRQPMSMADQFGIIEVDPSDPRRIRQFVEKPSDATPYGLPDSPGEVLASMGNYVFDADALVEAVTRDADEIGSKHDMGGDIVPAFVRRSQAAVYDYKDNEVPGANDRDRGYWRDVGTLRSYYDAHMDVVSPLPVFNLYNFEWPIFTSFGPQPPAKVVHADAVATVDEAVLSPGVVVAGATVTRSVLSPGVHAGSGALVEGAVLMNNVAVGAGAVIRNAIVDKNVVVPPGCRIGVDPEEDRARGFVVEDGLTVLGKDQPFRA